MTCNLRGGLKKANPTRSRYVVTAKTQDHHRATTTAYYFQQAAIASYMFPLDRTTSEYVVTLSAICRTTITPHPKWHCHCAHYPESRQLCSTYPTNCSPKSSASSPNLPLFKTSRSSIIDSIHSQTIRSSSATSV